VVWSPVVIAAAAGVAWSLAMMLVAREPDEPPVMLKADRDVPLARNGDYLIPTMKAPSDVAARWVPLAPAVKMDGGLPNEGLPLTDGASPPTPNATSSPASEPVRAEATPRRHARVRHAHDLCAAHGMRRKDFYRHNHWRSLRCIG
jgi:hypothetical protein